MSKINQWGKWWSKTKLKWYRYCKIAIRNTSYIFKNQNLIGFFKLNYNPLGLYENLKLSTRLLNGVGLYLDPFGDDFALDDDTSYLDDATKAPDAPEKEPGADSVAVNQDGVMVDEFGLPKIPTNAQ